MHLCYRRLIREHMTGLQITKAGNKHSKKLQWEGPQNPFLLAIIFNRVYLQGKPIGHKTNV